MATLTCPFSISKSWWMLKRMNFNYTICTPLAQLCSYRRLRSLWKVYFQDLCVRFSPALFQQPVFDDPHNLAQIKVHASVISISSSYFWLGSNNYDLQWAHACMPLLKYRGTPGHLLPSCQLLMSDSDKVLMPY